ncbi:MAG: hypothetical protein Q9227_007383 [Pyrenula ochraceoflavens]
MLARRMISREDEAANAGGSDIEVSREDQDQINRFSRLHAREERMEEELRGKVKDKEDLEELSTELELADEDELIPYKLGDSYMHLPLPRVQSLLSTSMEEVEKEVEGLEELLEKIREEMRGLKAKLYARFGRSINLEA